MKATKDLKGTARATWVQSAFLGWKGRERSLPPPPHAPGHGRPWAGQASALRAPWPSELGLRASAFHFSVLTHLCGSFHPEQDGRARTLVKAQSSGCKLGIPGRTPGRPWALWNYTQVFVPTQWPCISLVKASMISLQTKWTADVENALDSL